MTTIAGLASGSGRTLLHLADRRPGGAALGVVVTDDPDAAILGRAADRGVETVVVERAARMEAAEYDRRLLQALAEYDVDLVGLDGFDTEPSATFLEEAPLTIDAHSSLLPAFPVSQPVRAALEAGVSVTGSTVHLVRASSASVRADQNGDIPPILTQEAVPVYADDDHASLQERVRTQAKQKAYSRAVRLLAEGRVTVTDAAGQADVSNEGDDGGHADVSIEGDHGGRFPARRMLSEDRGRALRYGENPHQDAALYVDATATEASVVHADQLNPGAKALSYNNYNDGAAALDLIAEFSAPAAAVIKHTNPAGCAVADSLADAYDRALATDEKSAFGGVVSLNRPCDRATAERVVETFKEAVVAPGYSAAALAVLRQEDDLRVLDVGEIDPRAGGLVEKPIAGGRLVQDRDVTAPDPEELEVVTEREPTAAERETMAFAWRTIKHVKSNAIVFAAGTETVGIGMGQVSRVDAVSLAAMKAENDAEGKDAEGAVMASDAFFPFRDGIDEAATAGIEAVVQPGGSVNDDAVIEAADEHGMAMAFTGTRAFRHD